MDQELIPYHVVLVLLHLVGATLFNKPKTLSIVSNPIGIKFGATVLKYNVTFYSNEKLFNNTFLSCFIMHTECNSKALLYEPQVWSVKLTFNTSHP